MNVFVAQFLQTCVFVTITDANFIDFDGGKSIVSRYFYGQTTDFSVRWYKDQGDIVVYSSFLWAIYPLIDILVEYLKAVIYRRVDRVIGENGEVLSKAATIQMYVDLHAGPFFYIEYKYTTMLI